MNAVNADRVREQTLIWATALALFAALAVKAQSRFPEPFAEARAQLVVEQRELTWVAQGRGPTVELASFIDFRPLRAIEIRHEDLLERNSVGLR